jgi:hypothetical protein
MNRVLAPLAVVLALAGPAIAQADRAPTVPASLEVPAGNGRPVLLDGLFAAGEWDDALRVPVHERADLLLKSNSGHLFLGLKFKDALGVIVDLWLTADDTTVFQMHSSGQLGEGTLTLPAEDEWPQTRIGFTQGWDANEIKADSRKKAAWQEAGRPAEGYRETLFPSEGKEFQILLSKFAAPRLKMRFRAGDREGLIVYPKGTDLKSANGWQEIVVPEGGPDGEMEAEKREIARVVSSVIGWAKTKDLDLFFGSIAHDEDYISVTPGRRVIKRFEDVKQNVPFWMSPDFHYVRHELKGLEIKLARCGTVAWFYCVLDDINTYKGEPAAWENARWTGVVEKRDGRWVVVSQHFSFASEK